MTTGDDTMPLCYACAESIASRSWPVTNEDDGPGVPDIPELVDGVCPVCEGSEALEDAEGE